MLRAFPALVILCLSGVAHAQDAGGYDAGPGHDSGESGPVTPSPAWTQDRTFPGTRFWKLDKGRYEVEQWWRVRKPRDARAYHILQTELEFGLTNRVQFDFYENLSTERTGRLEHDGNQFEARIAFDPQYGHTPLNPTLYLEWQPRHLQGDRAEVRLLLGDELLGDKLIGAANLFYEQNVTSQPAMMGGTEFVPNPEAGVTGALSYAVKGQTLRVGAEMKLAVEKDLWSDTSYNPQALIGPNVSSRIYGEKMKVYATCLFGLTKASKQVDSFLILASGF